MAFPDYNDMAARDYAERLSQLDAADDARAEAARPAYEAKLASEDWLGEAVCYGTPGYDLNIQVLRELAQGAVSETTSKRMFRYLQDLADREAHDELPGWG